MNCDAALIEQDLKLSVTLTKVVDPNRSIDQDHCGGVCRRGVWTSCGSDPPSRASRRALSRWINALRASRTRADFSLRPVNCWALATSSSSNARVVRNGYLPDIGTNNSIK